LDNKGLTRRRVYQRVDGSRKARAALSLVVRPWPVAAI
jgi:hypothetical protein